MVPFVRSPQQTSKIISIKHLLNKGGHWESSQPTPSSGNRPPPPPLGIAPHPLAQKWVEPVWWTHTGLEDVESQNPGQGHLFFPWKVPTLPVSSFSLLGVPFFISAQGALFPNLNKGSVQSSRGPMWLLPQVTRDWLLWSRLIEPRVGQSDALSLKSES